MQIESASIAFVARKSAKRALFGVLASVVLFFLGTRLFGGAAGTLMLLSFGGLIASILMYAQRRGGAVAGVVREGRPGRLVIDDRFARLATDRDDVPFALDEVVGGWLEEHGAQRWVVLELTKNRAISIQVASEDEGDALLDALGVGLRQRVLTLQIGGVSSGVSRGVIALIGAFGAVLAIPTTLLFCIFFAMWVMSVSGQHAIVPGVLSMFMAAAWALFLIPARMLALRKVTIGRDGVSVKLGVRAPKFVSYDGMDVKVSGRHIELSRAVSFPTTGFPEAAALSARIVRAQKAYREREATKLHLLSRAGRTVAAWEQTLRGLKDAPHDYRSGVVPSELLAIVEDPASPAEQRVGAAVVLASSDDTKARARLRVAIDATADPKLRVAFERAVEGEIDEGALDAATERHAS